MIRTGLVVLTLISSLLHAMLGCHWHHQACAANAAGGDCCSHKQNEETSGDQEEDHSSHEHEHRHVHEHQHEHSCSCDHEGTTADESEEEPSEEPAKDDQKHHHDHKSCDEGSCSFAVPSMPSAQVVSLSLSLDAAIATAARLPIVANRSTFFAESLPRSFFGCTGNLRAHLLKQIWLL